MSTRSAKKTFKRAGTKQASWMREGGLRIADCYIQVHESSYEPLATINELGLITYSSQDSRDWRSGDIQMRERSYVNGLMLPEEAPFFVDLVNMNSDKVAFWQEVTPFEPENVSHLTLSIRESGERGYSASVNYTKTMAEKVTKLCGLRKDFPAHKVCVFDPRWGRPAMAEDGLFGVVIEALEAVAAFKCRRKPTLQSAE